MKYKSMLLLTLSTVSFSAFATVPNTAPQLTGSYTSPCEITGIKLGDDEESSGLAFKSTMTFSDTTMTAQRWWYNDSLCLNEVIVPDNEIVVVSYKVGREMGVFNGWPMYEMTLADGADESDEESCFVLASLKLTDKKEALYVGFKESNGSCNIDTSAVWMK